QAAHSGACCRTNTATAQARGCHGRARCGDNPPRRGRNPAWKVNVTDDSGAIERRAKRTPVNAAGRQVGEHSEPGVEGPRPVASARESGTIPRIAGGSG